MQNKREPLGIKCSDSNCAEGLHCFRTKRGVTFEKGSCNSCGASPIDWERIKRRKIEDIEFTISALNQEFIRNHFWNETINDKAATNAKKKGKIELKQIIFNLLKRVIGEAIPFRDGMQTTMDPNHSSVIPFAQHATATCCRKCLEYWHDIPRGRELNESELGYCTELVLRYIELKLPDLTDEGL